MFQNRYVILCIIIYRIRHTITITDSSRICVTLLFNYIHLLCTTIVIKINQQRVGLICCFSTQDIKDSDKALREDCKVADTNRIGARVLIVAFCIERCKSVIGPISCGSLAT